MLHGKVGVARDMRVMSSQSIGHVEYEEDDSVGLGLRCIQKVTIILWLWSSFNWVVLEEGRLFVGKALR